jgi:hypothetical protein
MRQQLELQLECELHRAGDSFKCGQHFECGGRRRGGRDREEPERHVPDRCLGRAVYLWVADSHGKSSCSGACAGTWPPLTTKAPPVASKGVKAADLGTITRADGTLQVT